MDDHEQHQKYLDSVANGYVKAVTKARECLRAKPPVKYQSNGLRRVPLPKLSGDVMEYQPFISVFNCRVDCMNISDDDKFIHLFVRKEKQSRDAIQKCMVIGGTEGYKRALDILGNTYGNKHVITEKINLICAQLKVYVRLLTYAVWLTRQLMQF